MDPTTRTITEVLAIDGPAGAGKSTIARRAAEALGFAFLDSGAMYRAATWNIMQRGIDFADADAVAQATRACEISLRDEDAGRHVFVDGQDVTTEIRTPEVTENIRKLSDNPKVRECLVDRQRIFAAAQPTVAEGRDMGTVVFPDARCKIYLDASIDARAGRRHAEFQKNGSTLTIENVRDDVASRDAADTNRTHSPLRVAEDAHVIDTTALSPDDVLHAVIEYARGIF